MSSFYEKYIKERQKTPKGKYTAQKANARRREIPWDFTFETWWKVWQDSGRWEQRGTKGGQYVMSRLNDEGHYGPNNVFIQKQEDNSREFCKRRWKLETTLEDIEYNPETNPYSPIHWKRS
jgi:hypothetical protein